MVAVRQVKTRPVDRLVRAPRFPRPVQGVAIAARLCRPDIFSMTGGIEVRDGGLCVALAHGAKGTAAAK